MQKEIYHKAIGWWPMLQSCVNYRKAILSVACVKALRWRIVMN